MNLLRRVFHLLFAATLLALTVSARAQLNAQEQAIANLLTNASGQGRPFVEVDPILSSVARARAVDLARRHYFSHTNPDGYGANYLVRQAGYTLPASYSQAPDGNNIESLAAGDPTASSAWSSWMASPGHKQHLLAQLSFYAAQTSLGVGYYYDPNSDYKYYWVVITAPPPGPSLAISSPAANTGLTVAQASLAGTCGGVPAAARVAYRLENADGIGAFQNASGISQWTGSVSGLTPGPNTIRVRSLDGAGGTIKELTRTFRYVVLKPLVVSIDGTGKVTSGFLGTSQRELGARYNITASAPAGFLFDHWSGSAQAATPTISFVMAEGFALVAHFRVNPFYALKGAYTGLIGDASGTHATSGLLKLTMSVTGSFSGRLSLGGKAYSFSGKFDSNGGAQVTVKRTGLEPLALSLQLDLSMGSRQIAGSVTDGTFTAALTADLAPPTTIRHFAYGRYTLSLPPNPQDTGAQFPRGSGWATAVIGTTGAARLSGTLADGRAFSVASVVSAGGVLPVYVPLLSGTGSLAGVATVAESGVLSGTVLWTKPERLLDRYLPAAFATRISLAGARYVAPPVGTPPLEVATVEDNTALRLAGGDLDSGVQQLATLLPTSVVRITAPELPRIAVTLIRSTGRFTGTFVHPVTKSTSRINGVILQDRNAAAGFFLGQSASGAASFVPMQ